MAVEVSGALAQSDPNLVLSAAFKLRITQRDLATLQEGGWLNDEVWCSDSMKTILSEMLICGIFLKVFFIIY